MAEAGSKEQKIASFCTAGRRSKSGTARKRSRVRNCEGTTDRACQQASVLSGSGWSRFLVRAPGNVSITPCETKRVWLRRCRLQKRPCAMMSVGKHRNFPKQGEVCVAGVVAGPWGGGAGGLRKAHTLCQPAQIQTHDLTSLALSPETNTHVTRVCSCTLMLLRTVDSNVSF